MIWIVCFALFYRTISIALRKAQSMAQSSETPYHSLQLVQTEVDGKSVLAGHEQILGREFDMESEERPGPMLMFRFNPLDPATLEAAVAAYLEMFKQLPKDKRISFLSPGSSKSVVSVRTAVLEFCRSTGLDHQLFILEKSEDDPKDRDGGYDGHVQEFMPVTAPRDESRHLALSPKQETEIKQMVEDGAIVVSLDDIFSTGKTLTAIDELLMQIGVNVSHRFAVGAEVPATLVDIRGDELVWEPKEVVGEPKVEVETAFTIPLFAGEDVITIMERS